MEDTNQSEDRQQPSLPEEQQQPLHSDGQEPAETVAEKRPSPEQKAFKSWNEIKSFLKNTDLIEGAGGSGIFLERLRLMKEFRMISFKLLASLAMREKWALKLNPIRAEIREVFLDGHAAPEFLPAGTSETEAVLKRFFFPCSGSVELREYYSEFHYLFPVLSMLKEAGSDERFFSIWTTYASLFKEHAAKCRSRGKRGAIKEKEPIFQTVARLMIEAVGNKPTSTKAFESHMDIAFAVGRYLESSQAENEQVKAENLRYQKELSDSQQEAETLQDNLADKSESEKRLMVEIDQLKTELADKDRLLVQQRTLMESERENAVKEFSGKVRKALSLHLEHCRMYADRDVPKKDGILMELSEMETALNELTNSKDL
jgi:hypothetical protein